MSQRFGIDRSVAIDFGSTAFRLVHLPKKSSSSWAVTRLRCPMNDEHQSSAILQNSISMTSG